MKIKVSIDSEQCIEADIDNTVSNGEVQKADNVYVCLTTARMRKDDIEFYISLERFREIVEHINIITERNK